MYKNPILAKSRDAFLLLQGKKKIGIPWLSASTQRLPLPTLSTHVRVDVDWIKREWSAPRCGLNGLDTEDSCCVEVDACSRVFAHSLFFY